jgi:hypothetical protein
LYSCIVQYSTRYLCIYVYLIHSSSITLEASSSPPAPLASPQPFESARRINTPRLPEQSHPEHTPHTSSYLLILHILTYELSRSNQSINQSSKQANSYIANRNTRSAALRSAAHTLTAQVSIEPYKSINSRGTRPTDRHSIASSYDRQTSAIFFSCQSPDTTLLFRDHTTHILLTNCPVPGRVQFVKGIAETRHHGFLCSLDTRARDETTRIIVSPPQRCARAPITAFPCVATASLRCNQQLPSPYARRISRPTSSDQRSRRGSSRPSVRARLPVAVP